MYENEPNGFESIAARDVRALTECMTVCGRIGRARGADDLYVVVSQSGSEYLVDTREGVCECPDCQYRDAFCKHLRRCTYEAGMRPVPGWVERSELDPQLLAAEHVDGEPVFTTALEDDGTDADEQEATHRMTNENIGEGAAVAIADGGEILEAGTDKGERPDDCACVPTQLDLPCWPCWRAGHRSPNPDAGGET